MGWCDDFRSKDYNKEIKFPFNYRAEKLYRSDNIYDIIIEINYNKSPTIKKEEVRYSFISQREIIVLQKDALRCQKMTSNFFKEDI